ncbi:hypothetical protein [Pectobacterium brasiliense]|uniref:hypothetical protein n=1 Tax=Pectobacterium brasiliense TaxID=180957 RepID=UPI0012FD1997|nr:hypothetical protein [Pectobacterium brasiliense]MBA0209713.1 hypothetical protein [Pectobacterium brasiliense]MCH4992744.1 hypothetical protein [Pectobacterium brasiliense]
MARGARECERHNEEGKAARYAMCVSSHFYAAFSLLPHAWSGFVVFVFLICELNLFLVWCIG